MESPPTGRSSPRPVAPSWRNYGNTVFYTVVSTVVAMALTTCYAYVLSKKHLKGRGVLVGIAVCFFAAASDARAEEPRKTLYHVVAFRFKPDVKPEQTQALAAQLASRIR